MDPNWHANYQWLLRKYREDVSRAEQDYRLLHTDAFQAPRVRWYDRWLSRLGTRMVAWGLRLEDRCAKCADQWKVESREQGNSLVKIG